MFFFQISMQNTTQPTTHQDFKLDLRNLKPKMSLRFPNAKAWPLPPNQSSVRESPEEAHRKVWGGDFGVFMIWRVISNSSIFLEQISFGVISPLLVGQPVLLI